MDPASAIAGLITLAGSAIHGIITLRSFFEDFRGADKNVDSIITDLVTLQDALELLLQLRQTGGVTVDTAALLTRAVRDCQTDLNTWLATLRELDPGPRRGLVKLQRRLSAAFSQPRFVELRAKLSGHRSQITLLLEMLGRHYDIAQAQQLDVLHASQRANHADLSMSMRSIQTGLTNLQLNHASLDGIDARLQAMQLMLNQSLTSKATPPKRPRQRLERRPVRRSLFRRLGHSASHSQESSVVNIDDHQDQRETMIMRFVKTAVMIQESKGKVFTELVPATDMEFERSPDALKLAMIRNLQNLRLLVWLLRSDNLIVTARVLANGTGPCQLVKNASLVASHRRSIIGMESLRRQQFNTLQMKFNNNFGPGRYSPEDVVRAYFMSNAYGRDLFDFYLSRARDSPEEDPEPESDQFPNSSDPQWVRDRKSRLRPFLHFLNRGAPAGMPEGTFSQARKPSAVSRKKRKLTVASKGSRNFLDDMDFDMDNHKSEDKLSSPQEFLTFEVPDVDDGSGFHKGNTINDKLQRAAQYHVYRQQTGPPISSLANQSQYLARHEGEAGNNLLPVYEEQLTLLEQQNIQRQAQAAALMYSQMTATNDDNSRPERGRLSASTDEPLPDTDPHAGLTSPVVGGEASNDTRQKTLQQRRRNQNMIAQSKAAARLKEHMKRDNPKSSPGSDDRHNAGHASASHRQPPRHHDVVKDTTDGSDERRRLASMKAEARYKEKLKERTERQKMNQPGITPARSHLAALREAARMQVYSTDSSTEDDGDLDDDDEDDDDNDRPHRSNTPRPHPPQERLAEAASMQLLSNNSTDYPPGWFRNEPSDVDLLPASHGQVSINAKGYYLPPRETPNEVADTQMSDNFPQDEQVLDSLHQDKNAKRAGPTHTELMQAALSQVGQNAGMQTGRNTGTIRTDPPVHRSAGPPLAKMKWAASMQAYANRAPALRTSNGPPREQLRQAASMSASANSFSALAALEMEEPPHDRLKQAAMVMQQVQAAPSFEEVKKAPSRDTMEQAAGMQMFFQD